MQMIKSLLTKITKFVTNTIDKFKHKEPWYKYYTNKGPITYPKVSIYELIEKTAESYPFYEAYQYFGKTTTYREPPTHQPLSPNHGGFRGKHRA